MTSITVIVPVRNEAAAIRGTLLALLEQDYPKQHFEIIVADGSSEDATVAIVRELQRDHANLRLVFNPRRWSSAARNLGVRHMSGDVAVIVDGHCRVPDRNYLKNLAEAFAASGAECLGRPQPLAQQAQRDARLQMIARCSLQPEGLDARFSEHLVNAVLTLGHSLRRNQSWCVGAEKIL